MSGAYAYEVEQLKQILAEAQHAVFFGGAGVSTDSGIPDFRGAGGLYSKDGESGEYFLSVACLMQEPERFFEFYRTNMLFPYAQPNEAHLALAELERRGVIQAVITQNIDGLHQKAGSRQVTELHGTADKCSCIRCGKQFKGEYLTLTQGIPRCDSCGAMVRPEITLYGEALDAGVFYDAREQIACADVLIAGGTSLTVHPAAALVSDFQGEHLIIINHTPTPCDGLAELVIRDSLSDVLGALL